jgi:E3 ubiquitin-protein ligase MARCH6
MEINVALDELLGIRGPISALVRNLLWLLAFNATYLGIFGFVPKAIGSVAYSSMLNTTLCESVVKAVPYVYSNDKNQTTIISVLAQLENESTERNTTFRLSDLAIVILGYLSIACLIVMGRYALLLFQKVGQKFRRNSLRRTATQEVRRFPRVNGGQAVNNLEDQDVDDGDGIGSSLAAVLDTFVAIVKVGVLLFLKMFLLPLILGFCLDASTVYLFGHDLNRRLAFAGSDLFSFILLHWVAGITFMLLVTVFLLQLREVVHPDVLARVIRPQDPQPDLLGNLLNETVATHMKRMLLSLVIYAPLLSLHIYLPIRLFLASGLERNFTFFRLKLFYFLMPQVQIPLELVTFHLLMLALLERYKNSIGWMQHRWLKFISRRLGLVDYLLPRTISCFEPIACKPVLILDETDGPAEVDPSLIQLGTAHESGTLDENLFMSTFGEMETSLNGSISNVEGETMANGERVLVAEKTHIALPFFGGKICLVGASTNVILLPTKLGRHRFRLGDDMGEKGPIIEIFREVTGDVIARPPEGWDDLGVGGAWAQGRWAWYDERRSTIEGGVAQRTPFRASPKERWPIGLILRISSLLCLSWMAITMMAMALVTVPLAVGRSFYFLLRVPHDYIHDPLAFCIGSGLFFPLASILSRSTSGVDETLSQHIRLWKSKFTYPPRQKLQVTAEAFFLWCLVAPSMLGLLYDVTFVKSIQWFAREEKLFDWGSVFISWLMGTVVLNIWSFLLYFKCFTKQFWANVGNGMLEPPLHENRIPNPPLQNREPEVNNGEVFDRYENDVVWQGNHGRVANFFRILRVVLLNWEWDAVNRTALLEQFARPVTKQLASAFIGSTSLYCLLLYVLTVLFPVEGSEITFPILGPVSQGAFCMVAFRFCAVTHIFLQFASAFRGSINGWFEAAHEAARDDRYLTGEVLLNYDSNVNT